MPDPTFTDDDDTMGAVRALLEPIFLSHEPPIRYKPQRNAGFANDTPCAIVSRRGGLGLESFQGEIIRDNPILIVELWTTDEKLTGKYATWIEKRFKALGANKLEGQQPIPSAVEKSNLRGVSMSFQMTIK